MGLLTPAPAGALIGDDVADYFGVTHYKPPLPLSTGGETEAPPGGTGSETTERWKGLPTNVRHKRTKGKPVTAPISSPITKSKRWRS